VRILRPPTEAGNGTGPVKLEKTKSLTNDSIVELVEAGFSEGTIIRRIEQSPVEFDLAADKLEALRKRRVSDKVIVAMKAAMGEDK
jgi:siroheme synthase